MSESLCGGLKYRAIQGGHTPAVVRQGAGTAGGHLALPGAQRMGAQGGGPALLRETDITEQEQGSRLTASRCPPGPRPLAPHELWGKQARRALPLHCVQTSSYKPPSPGCSRLQQSPRDSGTIPPVNPHPVSGVCELGQDTGSRGRGGSLLGCRRKIVHMLRS